MPKIKNFRQKNFARIQGVAHLNPMDLIDSSSPEDDSNFNAKIKGKYNIQKVPGAHVPIPASSQKKDANSNPQKKSSSFRAGYETSFQKKEAVNFSEDGKREPESLESDDWGVLETAAGLETPAYLKSDDSDSSHESFAEKKMRPMSSTPIPTDDRASSSVFEIR